MKSVVFVFVLLVFCTSMYGQTELGFLQKTKDYINTEYTTLLLNSSASRNKKEDAKKVVSILSKNSLQQPFTYDELETLLQEKFDTVLNFSLKVEEIDNTAFTTLQPQEAVERLNDEAYYLSRESFNTAISLQHKKNLYEEIASELDTIKNEQEHTAFSATEKPIDPTGTRMMYSRNELWLVLMLMIAIGLLVYSFIRIDRLKAQLKDARQSINNLQATKRNEKDKIVPVYNEFRTLVTNKLKEYEENLLKLQNKIEEQDKMLQEAGPVAGKLQNSHVVKTANVLYMGAPSGNYFPANVQTTNKKNAYYKFVLNEDGQEAQFEVINDGAPLSEAIAHYAFYFEPACFATNKPAANSKKIITSFPGIASLNGDKWMIKQKAIIVFA